MNFTKTDYCSEDETILHCPECNNEYVHLIAITPVVEDEKLSVTLDFLCEEGHNFSSYLHNHKG